MSQEAVISAELDPHDELLVAPPIANPKAQAQLAALPKGEKDKLVDVELEKSKAENRHLKGEDPKGRIVKGIEDDQLWAMMRRFDKVKIMTALYST